MPRKRDPYRAEAPPIVPKDVRRFRQQNPIDAMIRDLRDEDHTDTEAPVVLDATLQEA